MTTYNVSGDLPEPAYAVGSESSLRQYSTYRYHSIGRPTLRVNDVRNAHDYPVAQYVGVRLALHQYGTQVGPTLTWYNENGVTKSFGNINPGNYAMQGRTHRIAIGGFSDPATDYWSGVLTLSVP